MEKRYWIGRKRAAMAMARAATDAEARLIHYELAGRYSIKAAAGIPFMLPRKGPANPGEGAALRLPDANFRAPPGLDGGSDGPRGGGR